LLPGGIEKAVLKISDDMELYISCAVKGPAMRKLTVPDSSIFSRSMVKLELFHD
jgi:hypothetical protein